MAIDLKKTDVVIVGLGAVEGLTRSLGPVTWTVLSDPEGNEFCVA